MTSNNNSWLTILEQDTYWVPKSGWDRYINGTPIEELRPGRERFELTDLDPEHLRRLPAFLLERYIANTYDEVFGMSRRHIGQVEAWRELAERPLMRAMLNVMATDSYVAWPDEYVLDFTADVTQAALVTVGAAQSKPFDPNGPLPNPDALTELFRQMHETLTAEVSSSMQALKSVQITDALTLAGAGEAAWPHLTRAAQAAGEFMPNDMRRVFFADAFHPNKVIEATQLVAT